MEKSLGPAVAKKLHTKEGKEVPKQQPKKEMPTNYLNKLKRPGRSTQMKIYKKKRM